MKKKSDIPLILPEIDDHIEQPHKHSWLFNVVVVLGLVAAFAISVYFYLSTKEKKEFKESEKTAVTRTQDPVERSQANELPPSQNQLHAFDTITKWDIDPSFKAIYEVTAIDDLSTVAEKKYRVRIIIPKEVKSVETINKNIQDLVAKFIRSYGTQFPDTKVHALQIWVYTVGSDINLNYTVAEGVFAPEGSFEASGHFTTYDDNILLIKYKDDFASEP